MVALNWTKFAIHLVSIFIVLVTVFIAVEFSWPSEFSRSVGSKNVTKRTQSPVSAIKISSLDIEFLNGSSDLTPDTIDNLQSLLENSKQQGRIGEIHIAAWADQKLSPEQDQLSRSERRLANKRIKEITRVIESFKELIEGAEVLKYSMAERDNFLSKNETRDDSELESIFAQKGAPENFGPEEFKVFRHDGGPRKAVILIKRAGQSRQPSSIPESRQHTKKDRSSASSSRSQQVK